MVRRIRRVRPEYREDGSWRLLHDNAPSHRSIFGKMHLPMKGKRNADVEAIQKACTGILAAIPGNELKHSFGMLLDRTKSCIKAEEDYFE